jgi:hypothetical protein
MEHVSNAEILRRATETIAELMRRTEILTPAGPAIEPDQCECGRRAYVKDTRGDTRGRRRRYVCACGARWSTLEVRHTFPKGAPRGRRL